MKDYWLKLGFCLELMPPHVRARYHMPYAAIGFHVGSGNFGTGFGTHEIWKRGPPTVSCQRKAFYTKILWGH